MIFVLAFAGTFISVFVKGFQHKNVNHDLRWHIAGTSYVMNVMELLLIGGYAKIIIDGNYWYAFVSGFAAAGGMISSIMFHDYFILKKRKGSEEKVDGICKMHE